MVGIPDYPKIKVEPANNLPFGRWQAWTYVTWVEKTPDFRGGTTDSPMRETVLAYGWTKQRALNKAIAQVKRRIAARERRERLTEVVDVSDG